MVIRLGFEPKTHSLEGCCSIQLSYRTALLNAAAKISLNLSFAKKICRHRCNSRNTPLLLLGCKLFHIVEQASNNKHIVLAEDVVVVRHKGCLGMLSRQQTLLFLRLNGDSLQLEA